MTIDEMKQLMKERGYSLNSHNGNKTSFNFTRGFYDDIIIHARVYLPEEQMELSTIVNLLTVSTGKFSLTHPRLEQLFEAPIIQAAIKLL